MVLRLSRSIITCNKAEAAETGTNLIVRFAVNHNFYRRKSRMFYKLTIYRNVTSQTAV